jgi:hypothetical protein
MLDQVVQEMSKKLNKFKKENQELKRQVHQREKDERRSSNKV